MCRIIAANGIGNDTLADALIQFGALAEKGIVPKTESPGHKDGWGIVAYNSPGRIAVYRKEPESATDNPQFAAAVEEAVSAKPLLTIAHLRKASVGSNLLENTQPYVYENFSFCHNGTIKAFEKFALDEEYRKFRKGTSDSEWIFYYLVQKIRKNPTRSLENTFKTFIDEIQSLDYTAFIVLFSDGHQLLAVREINDQNAWVQRNNLCDDYYTLYLGKSANQEKTIVCSQKLDLKDMEWKELPNHSVALIELQSLVPR